jgi:hypothetical protein
MGYEVCLGACGKYLLLKKTYEERYFLLPLAIIVSIMPGMFEAVFYEWSLTKGGPC